MHIELLSRGIYSIPMAAKLLSIEQRNLRGWVRGQYGATGTPIIPSEFDPISNHYAMSFVNLIEARLISAFANVGVSVRAIRYMVDEARRVMSHPHPFATEMVFKTDGKTIFMQAADATGDPKLYDLRKKNFAIIQVVEREFKRDIVYGGSGVASMWYPRKGIAPSVILSPKIAFGSPAVDEYGIPTEAIYDSYLAENNDAQAVARWFDIPVSRVNDAISFESAIRKILH